MTRAGPPSLESGEDRAGSSGAREPSPLSEDSGASRAVAGGRLAAAVFLGIGAVVSYLVWTLESSPDTTIELKGRLGPLPYAYTSADNELVLAGICGATALLLLVGLVVRLLWHDLAKRLRGPALAALLLLTVVGAFAYFYGDRGVALAHFLKFHDTYHYFLGPKYFAELGYFDLYDCTLVAAKELKRDLPRRAKVRDLRSYRYERVFQRLEATTCPENFSTERWQAFKQDCAFFLREYRRGMVEVVRDRGYNGTPFHTAVAAPLANLVEMSYATLARLSLIDVWALTGMLVCIALGFGNCAALLFALYAFSNFGDRFVLVGGSYLRYLWYGVLGVAIAMLKLRRYASAGVSLALATMLNVFPLFFFGGIALKIGRALVRRQPVAREHWRFVKAAVVTGALAGALSISHSAGIANYAAFKHDMDLHAGVVSTGRIGFPYVFLFRGEVTDDDPTVSNREKARQLAAPSIQIPYWALTVAFLGLGGFVALRLNDVAATCLLGVLAFYLLFGAVPYYYAILVFLVLVWHEHERQALRLAMIALWFLASLVVHVGWLITEFRPFVQSGLMTWTTGGYLLLSLLVLAFDAPGSSGVGPRASPGQGFTRVGRGRSREIRKASSAS